MTDHKVLLTGATGYIASQLLPTFKERYDLSLLDVKEQDREGNRVSDVAAVDLSNQSHNKKAKNQSKPVLVFCSIISSILLDSTLQSWPKGVGHRRRSLGREW